MIFFRNTFVLSRGDDEEDDFFVDDQDVNRLIIVTQVSVQLFMLYPFLYIAIYMMPRPCI
jgi:hypothetical protein